MFGLAELFAEYPVLGAFWMTIRLALCGAVGAIVIGTVVAIMRVSPIRIFQVAAAAYVNLFINTPLTIVAFFTYFGMYITLRVNLAPASSRLDVHAFWWGVVALALYHAAFVAENLRSGVNTVPQGQAEAARAIGLDFRASLREVILPQAFRGAIAPLGNTMVALTKNTTVLATIGVFEVSYLMKDVIEKSPTLLLQVFAVMATGFVLLTLPMGMLFTSLSKKLAVQR